MAPTVPVEYTGQKESKKYWISKMMGKKRKYSKGNLSSGFVPDFRHEVDAMGESEGFGSSGRVDTSEDSSIPKRKCISLNGDGYEMIPLRSLSLSKMVRSERRELGLKLRSELEQVRSLQKRAASIISNAGLLSPSDIRSSSDGRKRPLESIQVSSEVHVAQGKKKAPPGRNAPRMKRDMSGRFETPKQATALSSSNPMLMKQCETLLGRLMAHQYGWVFNTPVDAVKLNLPDYHNIIKNPMDLGTVKSKFARGHYSSPRDFAADVRLTFSNAMTYNPPKNDVHVMAGTLSKFFEQRWKAIEKKIPVVTDVETLPSRPVVDLETESAVSPSKRQRATAVDYKRNPEPTKREMSVAEKNTLSTELASLGELPENIIEFLKEHSFSENQAVEDEIEIDIDALSDDTLFALRDLLDDYFLKNQRKLEASEVELPNESGLSNSSMHPCKGNEPTEEDVDIGGNDPPQLGYPPIEIEKDVIARNSKCSSSSSSGSESGSSSSDSDLGNTSGSESDGAKASIPSTAKEAAGPVAILDEDKVDLVEAGTINHGLGSVEQTSQCKRALADETGNHQDGESAPSERQVSPEKLYRAALLRSRFADTILKAREKTLEKSEKLGTEKLRLDKEELERQQREEKARLKAEAKAAEEARRKAEAAAAAEAKKKRELDREAARLALQKMEKTVDINENSRFMEDLELFRAAPVDSLSLIDEMSPDPSLNALGSFKFEGSSNPLEQLGLYMKNDDDDEDEVEPQRIPDSGHLEEEEGEIHRILEPVNQLEEEEGELRRFSEPANHVEEEEGELRSPETENHLEEEGEVRRISEPLINMEEEEGELQCNHLDDEEGEVEGNHLKEEEDKLQSNHLKEEKGEIQVNSEPINHLKEEGELKSFCKSVNYLGKEEGELESIPKLVDYLVEGKGELRTISKTGNCLEVEGELQSSPNQVNHLEKGELERVPKPVSHVDEDKLQNSPNQVNHLEEEGEHQSFPNLVSHNEEKGELESISEPLDDLGEGKNVPQSIPNLQNDVRRGESDSERTSDPVNDTEAKCAYEMNAEMVNDVQEEGEHCRNPEPENVVEEGEHGRNLEPEVGIVEEGEPKGILEPESDVGKVGMPCTNLEPLNDVEGEGKPQRTPEPVNDFEEEVEPRRTEPVNVINQGEPRIIEPVNVVQEEGEPL